MTGVERGPRTEVTAVVVTWQSSLVLEDCLRSLAAWVPPHVDLHTVVVDNASGDGTVELVRQRWPAVEVIANTENVGFTRANNQAIRSSRSPWLLLINADARLTAGALDALMSRMDADPRAAIVAPRLVYDDGRWQRWTAGALPGIRSAAAYFLFLERLLPRRWASASLYLADDVTEAFRPGWVSSACMLVRRDALDDVGLFDEELFCYMDDVDICARAGQAGWSVWYEPGAEVVHLMGQSSSSRVGAPSPLALRSFNEYVGRHLGPARAAAIRAMEAVGFAARAVVYSARCLAPAPAARTRRQAQTHWVHLRTSLERGHD